MLHVPFHLLELQKQRGEFDDETPRVVHPASPESLKLRVQSFEFNAGVGCCELPIGYCTMLVAVFLPDGEFAGQH
jgi:hypothetical protein